mmetsp:Transcript_46358/g.140660  ORF Transcript_46358/g.140660 Transcript_46358/m.140660 type:complete len:242 (-) Transcript_46358:1682-2407(-)
MLRHSAMMPSPSSPTGLLLRIITWRSWVSAAPWSKNSSMVPSVKPMSSRNMVKMRLCSIALPMYSAPPGLMWLPDKFISSNVSHFRIMSPTASVAASEVMLLYARCTELKQADSAQPRQNSTMPSLCKSLLFKEMFRNAPCFSISSERSAAALVSMAQLSISRVCKWWQPNAARQTTPAPSDPMALFEMHSSSITVADKRSRAKQPRVCKPTWSARNTLKGLNLAMPAVSKSRPWSPTLLL